MDFPTLIIATNADPYKLLDAPSSMMEILVEWLLLSDKQLCHRALEAGYEQVFSYFCIEVPIDPLVQYGSISLVRKKGKNHPRLSYFIGKYGREDLLSLPHLNTDEILAGAIAGGHQGMVVSLISRANITERAKAAAVQGGDVFFLKKYGPPRDVNRAFVEAAKQGHRQVVDLLIEKGAVDWLGAAMAANLEGHQELVQYLLDKRTKAGVGGPVQLPSINDGYWQRLRSAPRTEEGVTPVLVGILRDSNDLSLVKEMCQWLYDQNIIEKLSSFWTNFLTEAIPDVSLTLVKELYPLGDIYSSRPLVRAIREGRREIIEFLINEREVDKVGRWDEALLAAIKREDPYLIDKLLSLIGKVPPRVMQAVMMSGNQQLLARLQA